MKNKTILPQSAKHLENRDKNEQLYALIHKRVKRSFLVRRLATVDDVTGDIFLMLVERELPDFETEEFERLLTKTVNRTVRRIKRSLREVLDIDELGESEHPFYEMNFHSEEEEFESVFVQFCESFPEPKRMVFAKCRVLSKNDTAALTGLSERYVTKLVKSMPGEFKKFFEKFSKTFSR